MQHLQSNLSPVLPALNIIGKINLTENKKSVSVSSGTKKMYPVGVYVTPENKVLVEPARPILDRDTTFKFYLNGKLKVARKINGEWVCTC